MMIVKVLIAVFVAILLQPADAQSRVGSNYDKFNRDPQSPTEVRVTMYLLTADICPKKMELSASLYLRQFWTDYRLRSSSAPPEMMIDQDSVWKPDTFVVNGIESRQGNYFLRLNNRGDLFYSQLLHVKAHCPMSLQYYPFDTQICSIELESFQYNMKDIKYRLDEQAVGISHDIALPSYKLTFQKSRRIEVALTTGNYSRIAVEFTFVHVFGYQVPSVFLPTACLLLLNYCIFWLNCRRYLAIRLFFSLLCLLAVAAIGFRASDEIAKVSFVTYLDNWFAGCWFLIVLGFLETMLVHLLSPESTEKAEGEAEKNDSKLRKVANVLAKWLDPGARVVYLVLYILFIIIYASSSGQS